MEIKEIHTLTEPGLEPYTQLTGAQMLNRKHPSEGVFIAESPKVILVALHAGYEPISLLCEKRHLEGDAKPILERCPDLTVYTGERNLLQTLTGYKLTRGVLCAMRRKPEVTVEAVTMGASRMAVIDNVVDATNIGAIFRSAAALGIDAVLLTRNSCDPLNRRAVRVSMGAVFLVPWTWINDAVAIPKSLGFKTVAMALTDKSVSIEDSELQKEERLAIIMGAEGDGLPQTTIERADYVARIPMSHQVDSLNVAAAAAVAFWQLRKK